MKRRSISQIIKQFIASIGWRLFMWGNETNEEAYWEEIYQQEYAFRQSGASDEY